ncbi:MAG: hypothetical protein ACQEXK_06105 [Bacillota bacterium]
MERRTFLWKILLWVAVLFEFLLTGHKNAFFREIIGVFIGKENKNPDTVSITEFGGIGDAVLIDKNYTLSNGRIVKSKEWVGTDNKLALIGALASKRKIHFPRGNYYISGDVFITNLDNISLEGVGKQESKIIHGRIRIKDSNTIHFNNLGFFGKGMVFSPDKPLTTENEKKTSQNHFWWLDYENVGYSSYAILTDVPENETTTYDIIADNCHFEMREGGIGTSRNINGTGIYVKNIKMIKCSTNHLWWHGMGIAYAKNVVAEKCEFKYHWIGMGTDFSSGTETSVMKECNLYKTSCMFKAESYDDSIGISRNCSIVNNFYTSFDALDNNLKEYCFKTAGENSIVENNTIILNDKYKSAFTLFGENTNISHNNIYLNYEIVSLISQYGSIRKNPSLKFIDNIIYIKNDLRYLIEIPGHNALVNSIFSFDIKRNMVHGNYYVVNLFFNGLDHLKLESVKIDGNSIKVKRLLWFNKIVSSCDSIVISNNSLSIASLGSFFDFFNGAINKIVFIDNHTFFDSDFVPNNSNKLNFITLNNTKINKLEVYRNQIQLNGTFINFVSNSKIELCYIKNNKILIDGLAYSYYFIKEDRLPEYKYGTFKDNEIIGNTLLNEANGTEITKSFDFKSWLYDENNTYRGKYKRINAKH